MASKENADEIEAAEVAVTLPPGGVYQMTSGSGTLMEEPVGHKLSIGAEHVPNLPLSKRLIGVIGTLTALSLICGAVLISLGVVITGLISFHANTINSYSPPLWWVGIVPFVIGMIGVHILSKKDRKQIYVWGLVQMIVALTQTIVMGWVGNFSTSHYDVWPPYQISHLNDSICQNLQGDSVCYCVNSHQGVYNEMKLLGVKYIEKGDQTWRETMYPDCDIARVVSMIYFSCMAVWGVYLLNTVISCIITHAVSVCVYDESDKFQILEEDAESHLAATEEELRNKEFKDNVEEESGDNSQTVAVAQIERSRIPGDGASSATPSVDKGSSVPPSEQIRPNQKAKDDKL